jgi:DNA segregation ATPase FtsK/SpoIIIE, S-DNA-T family
MSTAISNSNSEMKWSKKRIRELIGLAFVLFGIFIAVSLISFHSTDPSPNRSNANEVSNYAGKAGAYFADPLVQFLGFASSLIVIMFLAWGWRLIKNKKLPSAVYMRITMFLFSLVMLAALMHSFDFSSFTDISAGGAIGKLVVGWLKNYFIGKTYIPFVIIGLFISLPIAIGLSWQEWKNLVKACIASIKLSYKSLMMLFPPKQKYKEEEIEVIEEISDEEEKPIKKRNWLFSKKVPQDDVSLEDEVKQVRKSPVITSNNKAKIKNQQSSLDLKLPQGEYQLPSLELLTEPSKKAKKSQLNETALSQNARLLEGVLNDFGVKGDIANIRPGPVVTLYELEPAPGTKSSRVIGLADDIARSMSALSTRIATVPGRNVIGIEMPNQTREMVYFRELLEDDSFTNTQASLPIALGKDIGGTAMVVDLAKMPHLLVAGTTGSGKSVAINTMITSLLYKLTPQQCKFIMIDPKMLELSVYDNIPHLLSPVVTEPGKAVVALKWTVKEMENRYRLMSSLGVRNIDGYNKRINEAKLKGEKMVRSVQTGFNPDTGVPIIEEIPLDTNPLPFIVVVVDEMADLMLVAGKDIESSIQRLAQMARAAGIHIIMATQRPSVDVITGVIKANFPTRISFQVTSRIDSRTILGEQGAEQLLGQGDMLYMAGGGRITRVHAPFINDKEVEEIVAHLKTQGQPQYVEDVTKADDEDETEIGDGEEDGDDGEIYRQAVAIVMRDRKASTSYLQRTLKLGYNRAARLVDRMEREGIVTPANHVGKREVIG